MALVSTWCDPSQGSKDPKMPRLLEREGHRQPAFLIPIFRIRELKSREGKTGWKASVAGSRGRGRKMGEEVIKVVKDMSQRALWSTGKASDFMLSDLEAAGGF